jgi:hypothetical protein
MKKLRLLPVILVNFLLVSCYENDTNRDPIAAIPFDDSQILQDVKNHPEIFAPNIEQLRVKQIAATWQLVGGTGSPSTAFLNYEYYPDGKLKTIKGLNDELVNSFDYRDNVLTALRLTTYGSQLDKVPVLYLDNEGLALSKQGTNSMDRYYFKGGFLLRAIGNIKMKRTYSSTGNLLLCDDDGIKITFDYTDYPNTIRQEVLSTSVFHSTFRDTYFGKFSTNLVKSVLFDGVVGLQFSYEFDDLKRVKKINVNRLAAPKATIEYVLSY